MSTQRAQIASVACRPDVAYIPPLRTQFRTPAHRLSTNEALAAMEGVDG